MSVDIVYFVFMIVLGVLGAVYCIYKYFKNKNDCYMDFLFPLTTFLILHVCGLLQVCGLYGYIPNTQKIQANVSGLTHYSENEHRVYFETVTGDVYSYEQLGEFIIPNKAILTVNDNDTDYVFDDTVILVQPASDNEDSSVKCNKCKLIQEALTLKEEAKNDIASNNLDLSPLEIENNWLKGIAVTQKERIEELNKEIEILTQEKDKLALELNVEKATNENLKKILSEYMTNAF